MRAEGRTREFKAGGLIYVSTQTNATLSNSGLRNLGSGAGGRCRWRRRSRERRSGWSGDRRTRSRGSGNARPGSPTNGHHDGTTNRQHNSAAHRSHARIESNSARHDRATFDQSQFHHSGSNP